MWAAGDGVSQVIKSSITSLLGLLIHALLMEIFLDDSKAQFLHVWHRSRPSSDQRHQHAASYHSRTRLQSPFPFEHLVTPIA